MRFKRQQLDETVAEEVPKLRRAVCPAREGAQNAHLCFLPSLRLERRLRLNSAHPCGRKQLGLYAAITRIGWTYEARRPARCRCCRARALPFFPPDPSTCHNLRR